MIKKFDINSNDNTLFVTTNCNNNCIMCCQPPKTINDIDYCFKYNLKLLNVAPTNLPIIGISGGEPTLLGEKLIELITKIRSRMPNTIIHILSNGRKFNDFDFTKRVCEATGDKVMFGIPLHSDYYFDHDIIAGRVGAYYETMHGLYNLAQMGMCIELRVIINKINYSRLPQISDFIFKNLPFVSFVAFIGMEDVGYANTNRERIWIEPIDYKEELSMAVLNLQDWGIAADIYNIPHCLLDFSIQKYAVQSISDWKTVFIDTCNHCRLKSDCCGLFSTSANIYKGITAAP